MTVSRVSPDGNTTVEVVTVDDKQYDLPPWLTESEFREGLKSSDTTNALGSMLSCTLVNWIEDPLGGSGEIVPLFEAEWLVPFGSVKELASLVFTPVDKMYGGKDLVTEFTDAGVRLTLTGMEYFESFAVNVFLVPEDASKFELKNNDEETSFDLLYDLREDYEEVEEDAEMQYSDRLEKVTGPDDEQYIFYVHFRED